MTSASAAIAVTWPLGSVFSPPGRGSSAFVTCAVTSEPTMRTTTSLASGDLVGGARAGREQEVRDEDDRPSAGHGARTRRRRSVRRRWRLAGLRKPHGRPFSKHPDVRDMRSRLRESPEPWLSARSLFQPSRASRRPTAARCLSGFDVGVSYGLAAVVGLWTYRLRSSTMRALWLSVFVGTLGAAAVIGGDSTDLGHLIGLVCGLVLGWFVGRQVPEPDRTGTDRTTLEQEAPVAGTARPQHHTVSS